MVQTSGRNIGLGVVVVLGQMMLAAAMPVVAQQLSPPALAPTFAPLSTTAIPATSHLLVARDVASITGVSSTFTNIFNEFSSNIKQNMLTRPEATKDLDAVLAQLKPQTEKLVEDMTNTTARIFALRMTEVELKEILAFFNSPVGRRYTQIRPQMIDEVFSQLQPWTFRTSDFMYNFTKDEMKKRGFDIGG